jgi:uncharacterized protein with ParB-like and HNH nuclease domain/transcription elongation factor Elf1
MSLNDYESKIEFEETKGEIDEEIKLDEDKRTVLTKYSNPEITSLYEKSKRGRLVLQHEFQRKFVWDRKKASRLIESALLSVPLPLFYLAENADGSEYVIDGQQRLTSFFSFIDGKLPDGEDFKLTDMRVYPELNKKDYASLDKNLQEKILYYNISTVTILKESDPDLKFEIFERLNTGSVPLNDMELRNCVYRGIYMDLLKDLASDRDFRWLLKLDGPDKRMKDVELVLRFASFYHSTYLKYKPSMRQFFNRDMEKYKNISETEQEELRSAFKNSVQIVKSLFGENAFKRFHPGTESDPKGAWETKKFNSSLYDVWMGIFWDKNKNQVFANLDSLRDALIELMASNDAFIDSILIGTSDTKKVRTRFDIARNVVEKILSCSENQPRCFSYELKQELFDKNPTCEICGQRIQHIDDSAVDHIELYSKGGKTHPENARITHRYCNFARSNSIEKGD